MLFNGKKRVTSLIAGFTFLAYTALTPFPSLASSNLNKASPVQQQIQEEGCGMWDCGTREDCDREKQGCDNAEDDCDIHKQKPVCCKEDDKAYNLSLENQLKETKEYNKFVGDLCNKYPLFNYFAERGWVIHNEPPVDILQKIYFIEDPKQLKQFYTVIEEEVESKIIPGWTISTRKKIDCIEKEDIKTQRTEMYGDYFAGFDKADLRELRWYDPESGLKHIWVKQGKAPLPIIPEIITIDGLYVGEVENSLW